MSGPISPSPSPAAGATSISEGCDRDWFEQQYQEHAGLVLAFLRSRTSAAVADDLSQQVWMKVWRLASTHFDGTNFRAWVMQIARNTLLDGHRRSRRYQPLENAETVVQQEGSDDREEELSTRTAALRDCLSEISEELQVVIRARMVGEPYEAISERYSIPLGTAHSRFNKAKSQLQKCVAGRLA